MSKEIVSINELNINTFDTSSGVFMGYNKAHHWHSVSKVNQGFGQVISSKTKHTMNVIFDNDFIDMVTNEENQITTYEGRDSETSQHENFIKFNQLLANSLYNNASISVGENKQNLWHSQTKNNFGNGKLSGFNYLENMLNYVFDQDVVDIYSNINDDYTDLDRKDRNNDKSSLTNTIVESSYTEE